MPASGRRMGVLRMGVLRVGRPGVEPGAPAAWPLAERGRWYGTGVPADVPGLTQRAGVPPGGRLPKGVPRAWKGVALGGLAAASAVSWAAAAGRLGSRGASADPGLAAEGLGGSAKLKGAAAEGGPR
jgi:hypothetical protein